MAAWWVAPFCALLPVVGPCPERFVDGLAGPRQRSDAETSGTASASAPNTFCRCARSRARCPRIPAGLRLSEYAHAARRKRRADGDRRQARTQIGNNPARSGPVRQSRCQTDQWSAKSLATDRPSPRFESDWERLGTIGNDDPRMLGQGHRGLDGLKAPSVTGHSAGHSVERQLLDLTNSNSRPPSAYPQRPAQATDHYPCSRRSNKQSGAF